MIGLRDDFWFGTVEQKGHESNVEIKTDIVVGPCSTVGTIVDYAEREGADLIVIGTRRRSGFEKLLLGSTASGGCSLCTLSCIGCEITID
jgi:nucleotide-binding universal stress UspA family protein